MANIPAYVQKTLRMKPETAKVFDDLDAWLDHCRFNLLNYDPKDLYRSFEYRNFQREQEYLERKARRENRARQEH
jgi:hypothetical protein